MRAPRKSTIPPKPPLEHLLTYTCVQGHDHGADRAREVTDSFDSGSAALDALLAMDVDSDSDNESNLGLDPIVADAVMDTEPQWDAGEQCLNLLEAMAIGSSDDDDDNDPMQEGPAPTPDRVTLQQRSYIPGYSK